MKRHILLALAMLILTLPACAPKINLLGKGPTDPLMEFPITGTDDSKGKLALIHLRGVIESQPKRGTFTAKPSPVQEFVSALNLAEADQTVRGVVLAIDSPGGTITASDIIYHEINAFKERSGKKVVVAMFDIAASGGYYVALPADWIMAHPTTITGSVGVIYTRPKVMGLLDKVGMSVEVSKSGKDKDMGSPFRPTSEQEAELFQNLIDTYAARFHGLVAKHRTLTQENMELVKTARIFTADKALEIGLIDEIGYVGDVFAKARKLSGLSEEGLVVTYRRTRYPNDNPYNTLSETDAAKLNMLGVDTTMFMPPRAGFYYAWPQGLTQ